MGALGAPKATWCARYVSEFVGTYFLVLTVCCNAVADSIGAAISFGAAFMAMMYSLGPVSGGHFNPAVTAAVLARELCRISTKSSNPEVRQQFIGTALYVPVQLLAGFLAGLSAMLLYRHTFVFEPVGRYHWTTASAAEALYSSALCYVVLCVTSAQAQAQQAAGLAIGFMVVASALSIGGLSGCALNPAVPFGAACANLLAAPGYGVAGALLDHAPVYFAAPFIGSAVGLGFFSLVFPNDLEADCSLGATPRSARSVHDRIA
eukprot:TRINITY_DN54594_c0_g1_i1.p1 TRINITY_DN54594_c0_g1~~TRINITY_DN54594_c0_g1_i1.p1  ORF type:complete len:263 (+),score=42.37 TRINITY_DN54594_c0_g1_i1:218-1006(+)